MAASKIAITIDDRMLKQLDILFKSKYFLKRSKAIQVLPPLKINVHVIYAGAFQPP
jgi:metal-responsive CopG/Arc/MetJ family transcriptional regulator